MSGCYIVALNIERMKLRTALAVQFWAKAKAAEPKMQWIKYIFYQLPSILGNFQLILLLRLHHTSIFQLYKQLRVKNNKKKSCGI